VRTLSIHWPRSLQTLTMGSKGKSELKSLGISVLKNLNSLRLSTIQIRLRKRELT
jgi:hypothetical protein